MFLNYFRFKNNVIENTISGNTKERINLKYVGLIFHCTPSKKQSKENALVRSGDNEKNKLKLPSNASGYSILNTKIIDKI